MTKNYIDQQKDLVGKTIARTVSITAKLYLVFTDGTWTAYESREDEYGEGLNAPAILSKSVINHNDERAAGLIDDVEYRKRVAKYLKNEERRYKEQQKKQYEMLKAKFEK